jgi:hypothetical protein
MERSPAGIVGVEGDHDPAPGRDQHRVAHRAGKAHDVDLNHLKLVPVQVHRVGHRRLVAEHKFNALPPGHRQRRTSLFQTTSLIDQT